MKPETLAEMMQLAEAKPTASTPVPMTGHELMRCIDRAFYPPMNVPTMPGSGAPCTPTVILDALEKLDYDKTDLKVLRDYFKHCEEAELMRSKASRALQNLREEGNAADPQGLQKAVAY